MKSLALNASGATADALSSDSALPTLLSHAPRECEIYADLYGNIFFKPHHSPKPTSILVGFTDEHCATALACLQAARTAPLPFELVYMAQPCTRAQERPGLDALPVRPAPNASAFIGLTLHPPIAQHLHARWYQLHCQVDSKPDAHAMALSHNAIVLTFHSIQKIQALAQKLAGHNALQLSFSRLHTVPDVQQKVIVNFCARHPDANVLEALANRLVRCLPNDSCAHAVSFPAHAASLPHFATDLQRFCQRLATRHYPLSLASLHDAAYLASHGPSALVTVGPEPARNSQALLELIGTLSA